MSRKANGTYNNADRKSADNFEGYVTAKLESISSDISEVKEALKSHVNDCDSKIREIEKEQSKIKGIYLGVAAVVGALAGFLGRWLK